jgi:hypothetical protein
MKQKLISIITDADSSLGSGHFQRMLNLGDWISEKSSETNIRAEIVTSCQPIDYHGPAAIEKKISRKSSFIVRDKRDSTAEEIRQLGKIAPVMVIDDNGEGAGSADYRINLLPNHEIQNDPDYRPELFIYGYNFSKDIRNVKTEIFSKDIDVAIYSGFKSNMDLNETIISSFPKNLKCAVLNHERHLLIHGGNASQMDMPYSIILPSSKTAITHFGIFMYEASLCGCGLLIASPTDYHFKLARMITKNLDSKILSRGIDLKSEILWDAVFNKLSDSRNEISRKKIINIIDNNIKRFFTELDQILSSL